MNIEFIEKLENFLILNGKKKNLISSKIKFEYILDNYKLIYIEFNSSSILQIIKDKKIIFQEGVLDSIFSNFIKKDFEDKISLKYIPEVDLELEIDIKKINDLNEKDFEYIYDFFNKNS